MLGRAIDLDLVSPCLALLDLDLESPFGDVCVTRWDYSLYIMLYLSNTYEPVKTKKTMCRAQEIVALAAPPGVPAEVWLVGLS